MPAFGKRKVQKRYKIHLLRMAYSRSRATPHVPARPCNRKNENRYNVTYADIGAGVDGEWGEGGNMVGT